MVEMLSTNGNAHVPDPPKHFRRFQINEKLGQSRQKT